MKAIMVIAALMLCDFTFQETKWEVPSDAQKIVNPLIGDGKNIQSGKETFNKICWSCHGSEGKGDGPAASNLRNKPADFTSAEFKKQTEGSIYYKISEGRDEMASYKNLLSSKQRWQLVLFLQTLK